MKRLIPAAFLAVTAAAIYTLDFSTASAGRFGGAIDSTAPASALEAGDVLAIVADAGTLARADQDLYANTFVAQAMAPDGGAGTYAAMCSGVSCTWKWGPGSQNESTATSNQMVHRVALSVFQTTQMESFGCKPGVSCQMYADPGSWIRYVPTNDLSGCGASTEGGLRARDSDGRAVWCDGTTVQQVGFTLANSATLDFPSMLDNADATLTVAVTGAATSDAVGCSPTVAIEPGFQVAYSYVSAADAVTVVLHNGSGSTADPAGANYKCVVMR